MTPTKSTGILALQPNSHSEATTLQIVSDTRGQYNRPGRERGRRPLTPTLCRGRERGVGIGTVRYPRIVSKDHESARELKNRRLTNLYNQRPTWLDLAHKKLDQGVFAAYGWDPGMSDKALLEKLLELNLERAGKE